MSDSKPREVVVLTVYKDYYEQNIKVFSNPEVKIKSVFVEGDNYEGDTTHKMLLKKYMKAQTELRDYEFNKRYNK